MRWGWGEEKELSKKSYLGSKTRFLNPDFLILPELGPHGKYILGCWEREHTSCLFTGTPSSDLTVHPLTAFPPIQPFLGMLPLWHHRAACPSWASPVPTCAQRSLCKSWQSFPAGESPRPGKRFPSLEQEGGAQNTFHPELFNVGKEINKD